MRSLMSAMVSNLYGFALKIFTQVSDFLGNFCVSLN